MTYDKEKQNVLVWTKTLVKEILVYDVHSYYNNRIPISIAHALYAPKYLTK